LLLGLRNLPVIERLILLGQRVPESVAQEDVDDSGYSVSVLAS
jgi:hypothetical protein